MSNFLGQLGRYINRLGALVVSNYIPSAATFAVILTFLVFTCGVLVGGKSITQMTQFWGDGLFNLLKFSAQMCLILVCGFALAKTKIIDLILKRIALKLDTQTKAVMGITVVSLLGCYLNWGFGLVLSGIFAMKIIKQFHHYNFGILISSAYSGFLIWHGGLSGSIPLKISGDDKILLKSGYESIPFTDSIFSSFNLSLLLSVTITIIIVNYIFSTKASFKKGSEVDEKNFQASHDLSSKTNLPQSIAEKLNRSKTLVWGLALLGGFYLFNNPRLDFNMMIFIFLLLGLLMSGSLDEYTHNFSESIKASSGIMLQFPLYAGIMSMMEKSGLASLLSDLLINYSGENLFLFNTYLSAGLVNFFVPSGGGQWIVQGPVIIPAAKELGLSVSKVAMAISWGDAWSNMIQPFWALPLLSLGNLKLKDIMGHCIVLFFCVGFVTSMLMIFIQA